MTSMLELRRILPLLEKSVNEINLEDCLKFLKIYQGLEVFIRVEGLFIIDFREGVPLEGFLPDRTRPGP